MSMSQSSPPPTTSALYAATCNPPRRAKRPRHDSVSLEPSISAPQSTSSNAHNVRIRPAPTLPAPTAVPISPTHTLNNKDPLGGPPSATTAETEQTQLPPAKKRGRKPNNGSGGMSRSARESQRKINHSRIEKARRSKINDALDALRVLVPSNFASEAQPLSAGAHGKKEDKDKEFKLDILERTVLFVRHLVQKIDSLEKQTGTSAAPSKNTTIVDESNFLKRQREEVEEELSDLDGDMDDEDNLSIRNDVMETEADALSSQVETPVSKPVEVASAIQLPSISSWLDKMEPLDQQQVAARKFPVMSPPLPGSSQLHREPSTERRMSSRGTSGFDSDRGKEVKYDNGLGLLSPPGSGRINAMIQPILASPSMVAIGNVVGSLPSLQLPSPRAGLTSLLNEPERAPRPGPSRSNSKWTPEDENVASVLLQISSSASSSSASPPASSPRATRKDSVEGRVAKVMGERGDSTVMKKVQTPGAMLGIEFSSKGKLGNR
ncbi:hypothetical protein SCHPADRAFT_258469 [Schizopora paradoxa]|uniref:BHLH domain-containing protein n=1 Tax=Schizopora paradoxa TaxID=27342 RepID=A0A0H2RV94_9AGAM|nr:hypothetical protein SCHPADRAFT_258469 [Schizopora paradoxa]